MKTILTLFAFAFLIDSASYASAQDQPSATPTLSGFKVGDVPKTLRNGDIVFHDSGSGQSVAIKALTKSPYSHVGIYLNGFVYEAHNGVEKTAIAKWSDRPRTAEPHKNTTPWKALRLKDHPDGLSNEETKKMEGLFTPKVMAIGYDKLFQWSDTKLYCSELVWKAYEKLDVSVGKKETFAVFKFDTVEAIALANARYGGVDKLPLNETVVTPQAIYESNLLDLVPPLKER